jgi:phosphoribosylformylglycinamidine synthase PurS subunit
VRARVHITLKQGVLDPQGKAVAQALAALGFDGIGEVRQGKVLDIDFEETDAATARDSLDKMCKRLLANTVIEDYEITLVP